MESCDSCHGPNGPNQQRAIDPRLEEWSPPRIRYKNKQNLTISVLEPVDEIRENNPLHTSYLPSLLDFEACRDFIVEELGEEERLPYRLSYADGIQEVRTRLLSRYGDEKIGDAMDVVFELIENKDNASGLGDDGDRWAPWRFAHQHRHEDLSNLGTPRFPGLILPTSDRSLKAYRSQPSLRSKVEQTQFLPLARDQRGLSIHSTCSLVRVTDSENGDVVYFEPVAIPSRGAYRNQFWSDSTTLRDKSEGTRSLSSEIPFPDHVKTKPNESQQHNTTINVLVELPTKAKKSKIISTFATLRTSVVKKTARNNLPISKKAPMLPLLQPSPSLQLDGCVDEAGIFLPSTDLSVIGKHTGCIQPLYSLVQEAPSTDARQSIVMSQKPIDGINNKTTREILLSLCTLSDILKISLPCWNSFLSQSFPQLVPYRAGKSRKNIMSFDHASTEPVKYNPMDKYQSMAGINPFESAATAASYRETLAPRECFFPAVSPLAKIEGLDLNHQKVWVVPSKTGVASPQRAFRNGKSAPDLFYPRTSPQRQRYLVGGSLSRSLSDTDFEKPGLAARRNGGDGKPNLTINASPAKHTMSTINELDLEYAKNYKMELSNGPEGTAKVVRSPLKKLFGDRGILGRSASQRDSPDPRFKKPDRVPWSEKLKHRVEELSKDLTAALPTIDISRRTSAIYPAGPSTFPVTLSPYAQGDFYMQLELLLNIETNRFLLAQLAHGNLAPDSVRKTADAWKHKGRPQVLAFRYDLGTQRELVALNADTLAFVGLHALNRGKLHGVLGAWKVLAREVAVRTFCMPDSAVRKHLRDAERILELIDAPPESMLAFQEMRLRVLGEMYRGERLERERELDGIERVWGPERMEGVVEGFE